MSGDDLRWALESWSRGPVVASESSATHDVYPHSLQEAGPLCKINYEGYSEIQVQLPVFNLKLFLE